MNTNNTSPYLIPLAIIVAGGLVAAGIFFGGTKDMGGSNTGAKTAQAELAEIDIAPVNAEDHVLGNPNADIVMVEFSDTECPFCKQFHTTLHQVVDTYGKDGKVSWVYRHFPIDQLHKKARKEAEATECAAEQKGGDGFWKYIDEVYKRTLSNDKLDPVELGKIAAEIGLDTNKFNECLSSGRMAEVVEQDYQDARKAGGGGTPYTVFVSRKELDKSVIDFAATANANFGVQPGQEIILVSKDKKRVSLSGALPYAFIQELLTVLQK